MNALREALLRGKRRPRQTGCGSPTQYRGDGYEFVELREYVAGDDVRRIDWTSTARTGQLQTRVILEDVALTLAAILDSSGSMCVGRHRPLVEAGHRLLETWYGAAATDDRCVRVLDDCVIAPRGLRGAASAQRCLAQSDAPHFWLLQALDVAAATLPRGSALLVISDFFDSEPEHEAILGIMGRRFDCTALIARDPWRDDLPLRGFVAVRDAETAAVRRMFIGERERRRYASAVAARETETVARLNRANWRTGFFGERDGRSALLRAFALA